MSDHKVNVEKVDNGVWWDFVTKATCPGNKPDASHGCFLVVPNLSGGYLMALAEEQQPYMATLRMATPEDPKAAEEHAALVDSITRRTRARAMARSSLRGWANWEDDDGNAIEYSQAAAMELLAKREWCLFLDFVQNAAFNVDAILAREEAEALGN